MGRKALRTMHFTEDSTADAGSLGWIGIGICLRLITCYRCMVLWTNGEGDTHIDESPVRNCWVVDDALLQRKLCCSFTESCLMPCCPGATNHWFLSSMRRAASLGCSTGSQASGYDTHNGHATSTLQMLQKESHLHHWLIIPATNTSISQVFISFHDEVLRMIPVNAMAPLLFLHSSPRHGVLTKPGGHAKGGIHAERMQGSITRR